MLKQSRISKFSGGGPPLQGEGKEGEEREGKANVRREGKDREGTGEGRREGGEEWGWWEGSGGALDMGSAPP